jgi:formate C-acetyltransferase
MLQDEFAGKILLGKAIATFEFFAKWGRDVGASADGRFSGAPVATNFSPGTEAVSGPTAIIQSATKAKMYRYGLGAPIDIKINNNETKGESGLERLIGLIKAFLELGGNMLTITGVSNEELRDAQIHPMDHKNLRVRLGGLSAYFIALSQEVQDSIIERTSHAL